MDENENDVDEAGTVVIAPTRLIIEITDITQQELDHIINTVESFVEVVGGSVVFRQEPIEEDGIEEALDGPDAEV